MLQSLQVNIVIKSDLILGPWFQILLKHLRGNDHAFSGNYLNF